MTNSMVATDRLFPFSEHLGSVGGFSFRPRGHLSNGRPNVMGAR